MKILMLIAALFCVASGDIEASSNQNNNRAAVSTKTNSFLAVPKQEVLYQQMQLQQQQYQPQQYQSQQYQPQQYQPQQYQPQQYIPVQFVQTPIYQHQQPQPAMIIIAQPAAVPQHMLHSSATQQLLNYFNSNPHAKYQLIQGYQQQQPVQQYTAQPAAPSPAYTYQIMAAHTHPQLQPHRQIQTQSQYQFSPSAQIHNQSPTQAAPIQPQHFQQYGPTAASHTYNQASQFSVPNIGSSLGALPTTSLSHISTLAQLTAQKYLPQLRTASPIITGLENFTPEQQAQIKAQLSSGGPITPLQSNVLPSAPVQQDISNQQLAKAQPQPTQNTGPQEFTASSEEKASNQAQNTNYNSGIDYRNQFTKG